MKSNFKINNKGFHFSLDAVFAIIVLIISLGLFFSVSYSQVASSPKAFQKQVSLDLLNVLDKTGALSSFNYSSLNSAVAQNMPPNYNYSILFSRYNSNTMALIDSITVANAADTNVIGVVETSRPFVIFANNDINYLGVAKARVWPK